MTNLFRCQIGGPFQYDAGSFAKVGGESLVDYFQLDSNHFLASSGRGAFAGILDHGVDAKGEIVLPDYLCSEALMPVIEKRGMSYKLYDVDDNFQVGHESLLQQINSKTAAVMLINYFGCIDNSEIASKVRDEFSNVRIILNNVQNLYGMRQNGKQGAWADFQFCSLGKFLPVADGAIGIGKSSFDNISMPATDQKRILTYVTAAALKKYSIEIAGESSQAELSAYYQELFAELANSVDFESRQISGFSQEVVSHLPLDDYANTRCNNHRVLVDGLGDISAIQIPFRSLENEQVPLAFPILVGEKDRDQLRQHLIDEYVYCPVHWKMNESFLQRCSEKSRLRARRLLSLPLDQRYTDTDMDRLVNSIRKYYSAS